MDEKSKLSISLEQWQVIDRIESIIKRYKNKRYNNTRISIEKLLEVYRKEPKIFSWYSDGNGLTLEGYICLLAKKHSIPTYAVFVLLDAYDRYKTASNLEENEHSVLYGVFNIAGKPYFTFGGHNYIAVAFEEVYSQKRYYTAINLLVRKGLLLHSNKQYKHRNLYSLTSKALADLDILEGAMKRLNELYKILSTNV